MGRGLLKKQNKKKSHVMFVTGSNDTQQCQIKYTYAPNLVSGSPRLAVCGFVVLIFLFSFFKSYSTFLHGLYGAQCPGCLHISKRETTSVAAFC